MRRAAAAHDAPPSAAPLHTPCFVCVRGAWLPRPLPLAIATVCPALLAFAAALHSRRALLGIGLAPLGAYASLAALRALEDAALRLSAATVRRRAECRLAPLCVPAAALAAALCCVHALASTWLPRLLARFAAADV
ncbi:hypothetical protein AB1Y20_010960 [Prymnesium parvum]|uniref:Dolichol kinase n=1 Tax=Prymnesium parvum TaxID=97485 RepID=A0AB34IQY8_PRYPA